MKLLSVDVAVVAPVFQWIFTRFAHWPVGKLRFAFDVARNYCLLNNKWQRGYDGPINQLNEIVMMVVLFALMMNRA